MELDDVVGELIESMVEPNTDAFESMSFVDYIRDYRTIGVIVPRQTGKTTLLDEISDATDNRCIRFVCKSSLNPQRHIDISNRRVYTFEELEFLIATYFLPPVKEKFCTILIDEFPKMTAGQSYSMNEFIDRLYKNGNIDKNFFVLKLGT